MPIAFSLCKNCLGSASQGDKVISERTFIELFISIIERTIENNKFATCFRSVWEDPEGFDKAKFRTTKQKIEVKQDTK